MRDESMKIFDHGLVRLIGHMGDDLSIARSARIAPDATWRRGESSDERLIRYLWLHAQTGPFEAAAFQFEVKAPAFVFLQWHGHQAWTFTEVPTRHCALPKEFYLPEAEVVAVHPPSEGLDQAAIAMSVELARRQTGELARHCADALALCQQLLDRGWRPELVHGMMPLCAYRHMFVKVDLLNLLRFLRLRFDDEMQYELRVYAEALRDLVRPIVPVALSTWEETGGTL